MKSLEELLDQERARDCTDPEELDRLAKSRSDLARYFVAMSPNTKVETLYKLVGDHNVNVRLQIAKNPNTSTDSLSKLIYDDRSGVRWNVARHLNTSIDTLVKLSKDEHKYVVDAAKKNLDSRDMLSDLLGESKQAGSLHGLTDEEIIDVIRSETDSDKLMEYDLLITTLDQEMEIARNPNLSESDQHKFVKRDIHTCEALTENENLAESTALKIIHRTHDAMFHGKIARKAASKISTPHLIAMLKMEEKYAKVAKEELKLRDVLGDLLGESRCYESFEEWRNS